MSNKIYLIKRILSLFIYNLKHGEILYKIKKREERENGLGEYIWYSFSIKKKRTYTDFILIIK